MADPDSVQADISGVNPNGSPQMWRIVTSRYDHGPDAIVGNPDKQNWDSTHDGIHYSGHFDAFEQIVPIGDQISWTHKFSDGIVRDPRFILHELMEDLIARRKAAGQPTTSYPNAKQPPQ